ESGVPNAIKVFEELRQKGHKPAGIRLDSGDLAYLSIHAARQLNQAGFPDVTIVLSNNLDELAIWQIVTQIRHEAPRYGLDAEELIKRMAYGVGTGLITSRGAAALDGVYKLVAVEEDGEWVPAIKISENPQKTLTPGDKRVWRVYDKRGRATADLIALHEEDVESYDCLTLRHPSLHSTRRSLSADDIERIEPLLEQVYREGRQVMESPGIEEMRAIREGDMKKLDPGVRRMVNPHVYHVSLTQKLWDLKQTMINQLSNGSEG
ncbi:MAG TPA: hypothetical protein VLT88_04845, partial [Desulfosarcina sp.]|nr:hypothetical protein [Desulfosarcina sp.]